MYEGIEYKFKKESAYNKRIRSLFLLYLGACIASALLKIFFKFSFLIMLLLSIVLVLILLAGKLRIFDKINILNGEEREKYKEKNYNEELSILRGILKGNNLYNEKIIKDLIEHYRNLISPKISKFNIIEILSIIVTIVFGIYDTMYSEGNIQKLVSIIITIILIIAICFSYYQFKSAIIMLKGEENIYERLEDLLSSLYIEIINDNNFKVKKKKNK